MTVDVEDRKRQFTGTGSAGPFPITLPFYDTTDLVVYKTEIATGLDTVLTEGADYTLAYASGSDFTNGANLTLSLPLTSLYRLTAARELPYTQEIPYTPSDKFPAVSHMRGLDRLCMQIQQLKETLSRAAVVAITSTISTLTFPVAEAGKLLGWNATATGLENKDAATLTFVLPSFLNNWGSLLVVNQAQNSVEYVPWGDPHQSSYKSNGVN